MLKKICDCVYNYEMSEIKDLVNAALAEGLPAKDILQDGFMKAMELVGESFNEGDFFVPEMLMAAKTMAEGLDVIKPLLIDDTGEAISQGKVVIGTVQGDQHDIGKNIVAMFIEGAGFDVFDLGIDVPAEAFVEKAKEIGADYVCISAMLTTTMKQMQVIVDLLKSEGLFGKIKPMVGGAPVTEKFADDMDASYAFDAASAVVKLKELAS
ncbi:MAG: corrinoid protein [Clostridiales bacterium]|nr:corrinoid protein [Clostridiales bacterium]